MNSWLCHWLGLKDSKLPSFFLNLVAVQPHSLGYYYLNFLFKLHTNVGLNGYEPHWGYCNLAW